MKNLTLKRLVKSVCAIALFTLASCSSVTMNKPLPSNSPVEMREELEGQWINQEGSCSVKFDANGVGRIASLEWSDEKQEFESKENKFSLTVIGGDLYLSAHPEGKELRYALAKCVVDQDNLIVWGANTTAFKELIESKKLAGSVEVDKHSTTVALSSSSDEIVNLLENSKRKDLFDFETPIVLRRIAK